MNMNIFPSEKQMRKEKAPHVSHINSNMIESGFIGLRRKKLEEDVTPSPFIRVKDLIQFKMLLVEIVLVFVMSSLVGNGGCSSQEIKVGGGGGAHEVPR